VLHIDPSKEMNKLNIQEEVKNDSSNHQLRTQENPLDQDNLDKLPKSYKFVQNHPIEQIIGEPSEGVRTRALLHHFCNNVAFISKVEPTCIDQALEDEFWIKAMQEELDQFKRNEV